MQDSDFKKPDTVEQEIILNPTKEIMSKTNKDGILEFVNDYFVEMSGYEEYELMGKSIYCTQHPDMPEVIFKMMWEKLLKKENFQILIKNLAKNGKFYWAISDFAYKLDDETDEIISIYNRRKKASRETISFFGKLYTKLKDIEKESGIILSERYLNGHLEEIGKSFSELLISHSNNTATKSAPIISIVPPKASEIKSTTIKEREAAIKEQIKSFDKNIKPKTAITPKAVIPKTIIPKTVIPKTEQKDDTSKKKSLFQKLFGKTEEELAAERKKE